MLPQPICSPGLDLGFDRARMPVGELIHPLACRFERSALVRPMQSNAAPTREILDWRCPSGYAGTSLESAAPPQSSLSGGECNDAYFMHVGHQGARRFQRFRVKSGKAQASWHSLGFADEAGGSITGPDALGTDPGWFLLATAPAIYGWRTMTPQAARAPPAQPATTPSGQ